MTSREFYHEFEANFRGSREEIIARLQVYLPFLRPFLEDATQPPVVADLGCGRGEWLELVGEHGFQAVGVDLDDGMLDDCFKRSLPARKSDAVLFLRSLADSSQSVVSGFHIAEHLPFEVLQTLIGEAHRVLRPGGLLILETPNAENLDVGTLGFHMDPTHQKPLPPGLLSFLPRYNGFVRSKVIRLQENKKLENASIVRLIDVFRGVSPDYAVVAQKSASETFLKRFDEPFNMNYGLTLDTLSNSFEEGLRQRLQSAEDRSRYNEERIGQLERQLHEFADYQQRIVALYESTSWRVTKPLRLASRLAAGAKSCLGQAKTSSSRAIFRKARWLAMLAAGQPLLRRAGKRVIRRFPRIGVAIRSFLLPASNGLPNRHFHNDVSLSQLSPKARHLYNELGKRLKPDG